MTTILIATVLLVVMTILTGVFMIYKNMSGDQARLKRILRTNLFVLVPLMLAVFVLLAPDFAAAEANVSGGNGLGFLAAALSTGLACIGAGYAVAVVGSAALGAISEDPSILGKTLIYVGLAEGIAIWGLIVAIMILGRL